jgi:hypothetical protein
VNYSIKRLEEIIEEINALIIKIDHNIFEIAY